MTSKDVIIDYLTDNLSAVVDGVKEGKYKMHHVKLAHKILCEKGNPAHYSDLSEFIESSKRSRGRPQVKAGDSSLYIVQQLTGHPPFIRVPVSTLGCKKEDKLHIEFLDDEIRIKKL